MRVVVKGNKHQAALAAAERGIPFAFVFEHRSIASGNQSYEVVSGDVPNAYELEVAKWFCEEGDAPYPIGSCLWYRHAS